MVAEGGFKQKAQFPTREAPGGGAQQAAVSDDNKASRGETQRLQQEAQAKIAATRHPNEIGSTP